MHSRVVGLRLEGNLVDNGVSQNAISCYRPTTLQLSVDANPVSR